MSLLKCEDIPECEENVDTCVKNPHEDTTSYPEALEEPFCSNSSDIANLNRCNLQVKYFFKLLIPYLSFDMVIFIFRLLVKILRDLLYVLVIIRILGLVRPVLVPAVTILVSVLPVTTTVQNKITTITFPVQLLTLQL